MRKSIYYIQLPIYCTCLALYFGMIGSAFANPFQDKHDTEASLQNNSVTSKIIISLTQEHKYLDTSALPVNTKENFQTFIQRKRSVALASQTYPVRKRPQPDMFTYAVYYDTETHEYWVHQTGGRSGAAKFFGPSKFASAK